MPEPENGLSEWQEKVLDGLELAYERMIAFKKYKNSPLIVRQAGKIVKLDPHKAPQTIRIKR